MPVARSQGCISDVSMQTDDYADQGQFDKVLTVLKDRKGPNTVTRGVYKLQIVHLQSKTLIAG